MLVLESGASVTVLIDSGPTVLFRTANIQKMRWVVTSMAGRWDSSSSWSFFVYGGR